MTQPFLSAIHGGVERIAKQYGVAKEKAFLIWFGTSLLDLTEEEAFEAVSLDGANDKGIDFFYIDEEDQKIVIGQGKYSHSLDVNVKESHVSTLTSSIDWFSNPESLKKEGRPELATAADDYGEAIERGYPVEFWFIYTAKKRPNIAKKIQVYNTNPDNLALNRSIRHYDLDLITDLWKETEGATQRISQEELGIVDGKAIEFSGSFGEAITVSLPASQLRDLYDKYGDRLFDRNVRLYLGARKGSVNAGILETLSDGKERENFWAYNNGITILCDSFTKAKNGKKIIVDNFSIVNGCQTTVSISQSGEEIDDVSVLCRVIAAPAEVVDNIIAFNNSQNPIRPWDIASQDKTQRRLKSDFDGLAHPWIYLTRRGARPKGNLKKFRDSSGKLRMLKLDLVGQYAAAYRERPVLAYKNKGFIFTKFRDEIFPPDVGVLEVLFQSICGDICGELVRSRLKNKNPEEIRILKKGGALFVLSVVSQTIRTRNGNTFLIKLDEERIISKKMKDRVRKYAEYAMEAYLTAVEDEEDKENAELSSLIRSPEFFERVAKRIARTYKKDAMAEKWINEALPKLAN